MVPNAVREEKHGGRVAWDGMAVTYHYKGRFEPWQLRREKRGDNVKTHAHGWLLKGVNLQVNLSGVGLE